MTTCTSSQTPVNDTEPHNAATQAPSRLQTLSIELRLRHYLLKRHCEFYVVSVASRVHAIFENGDIISLLIELPTRLLQLLRGKYDQFDLQGLRHRLVLYCHTSKISPVP